MSTKTLQELFNTVATHLIKQGKRAEAKIDGYVCCRYRAPKGLKCAVGCLIPDDSYTTELEGRSIYCESVADAVGVPLYQNPAMKLRSREVELLGALQTVHDTIDPSYWVEELNIKARGFSLDGVITAPFFARAA